jgi:hemolysin activation/secretion protein
MHLCNLTAGKSVFARATWRRCLPGAMSEQTYGGADLFRSARHPHVGAAAPFSRVYVHALLCALVALLLGNLAATAQTVAPSQVTPQSLRPAATGTGAVIIPSAAGLTTPAGAEKLSVTMRRVVIEGAFEDLAPVNEAFSAAVSNHRVSVAEIYNAVRALETAYASAGYILVRVVLPPQHLNDGGTLRLIVVDGFIEAVDVNALPERVRPLVLARMHDIIGRRRVKAGEIERKLLIAGDLPGLKLRSTLARGDQEGGTKLILDGTQNVVTGTVGTDNRLPSSLGTWSINGSVAFNNVIGLGEQVYASTVLPGEIEHAFDPTAPIRVVGGGVVIPLDANGWVLNPEYTLSRTQPNTLPGVLDTVGSFERWAVRTSYPVVRERATSFVIQGAFEAITQYNNAPDFGVDLSRDRYDAARGGANWGFLMPWGMSVQADALLSRGLGGRDESEADASGIPLSRIGASPVFTKASGDIKLTQPLPQAFELAVIGRGQSSFGTPLLLSEQFSLDDTNGLSSFPLGTFTVDEGWTIRGELSHAFDWRYQRLAATLVPYVFASTGNGFLRMPTAVEQSEVTASAIGVGMRTGLNEVTGITGLTAAIEFGKQYSDEAGLPVGYRTMATVSERF